MKKFIFPILLFGATVTAGHALTCVPKTGTPPTGSNYLQYWNDTYLQCGGGGGESFYKCAQNVIVEGWDGNLHKCTNNGWETVDNIGDCTGSLDQIEKQYNGLSNVGTLYSNFPGNTEEAFVYYYNTDEEKGYTAIENACKYSFTEFDKAYEECRRKGGDFLSWDDNDTVNLCEENNNPPQTTTPEAKKNTPKQYRDIACRDTGGDRYDSKNDKCICNTDEKHLTTVPSEEGYSICQCIAGYHRDGTPDENGKYPATGECVDAGDYETHEEFDSAAWRKDTEDAYRNEYDNAQNWANKGVTAASTLMTGEGAMMAARAIAEQKADKKAEEQMAEWISKMGCEYGNGQPVDLGKEETLPAGDLAKYYAEYKQLADKLKETKTALNLRPGIESEVLYDRAETGLYQYQTAERQSGGFTSLSRALMDPTGTDAEQWNAQKAEVAQKLQTGTLLTAGGLVVGAAGNYFVNRNHKPLELKRKLNTIKTRLENEYPEIFIPTPEEPVVEEETVEEEPEKPNTPVTSPETASLNMPVSAAAFKSGHITLSNRGIEALTAQANSINNVQTDTKKITNIEIVAKGYADPDRINPNWIDGLTREYTKELNQQLPSEYGSKIDSNDKLARARAEKVIQFLISNFNSELQAKVTDTTPTGQEDSNCTKRSTNAEKENCRHVDVEITITTETTITE